MRLFMNSCFYSNNKCNLNLSMKVFFICLIFLTSCAKYKSEPLEDFTAQSESQVQEQIKE